MRLRKSAVVAILALAVAGGAILMSKGVPGRPIPVNRAELLQSVMSHLERGYIDSAQPNQLYDLAIRGMLRRLGDAHAAYLPAERASLLRERASGQLVGPGFDIDERDGYIVVVSAYAGSSASRAGLRTGDRVLLVNGARTYGMSAEEVRQAIQGTPGTRVDIAFSRTGVPDQITHSLTREAPPTRSVRAAFLLNNDVGYVKVDRFSPATANALTAAIDTLSSQRIASLVVDLRGNPGGAPEDGIAVADLFLPSGSQLASTRGRSAADVNGFVDRSAPRWSDLELILLVDEGTANASEITAGALQDLDRALVIGRHTFGRGSKQELIPLSNGGAVMLTTARWYTPLGRRIEAEPEAPRRRGPGGVNPDESRPEHKTGAGRTLLGGGGIRPDVIVRRAEPGSPAGVEPLPLQLYTRQQAGELVQRDAFVRVAVELASQARGQSDLFARAQAIDSLDTDDSGGSGGGADGGGGGGGGSR